MYSENEIRNSIKSRQKLEINYDNEGARIVAPHILFIDSTNDKLIDAYQDCGFSKHPESIPGWRTFNILKITQLKTLGETFNIADGYNPLNTDKYRVIIDKI